MSLINKHNISSNKMLFYKRKYYRVIDNSFQNCLSDGRNYSLAGMYGDNNQQTVEIIRGPYTKRVTWGTLIDANYQFIVGKCKNGLLHEIIFHQCGLVD